MQIRTTVRSGLGVGPCPPSHDAPNETAMRCAEIILYDINFMQQKHFPGVKMKDREDVMSTTNHRILLRAQWRAFLTKEFCVVLLKHNTS